MRDTASSAITPNTQVLPVPDLACAITSDGMVSQGERRDYMVVMSR